MISYIIIDGWKSNIRFSSAHIIHEYKKCGRLHGHTYAVHIKIVGEKDEKGIIIDFSILKEKLRKIIAELDHHVLIPSKSKIINITYEKENVKISSLNKSYVLPKFDCVFLPIHSTSAENLSEYLLDRLLKEFELPNKIYSIEIGIDEGYGQGARVEKNFIK